MKVSPYFWLFASRIIFAIAACFAILCSSPDIRADVPPPTLLNYTNHWAGNTGGKGGHDENADDISNFVIDLGVLNLEELPGPMLAFAPLVVTKSYWDETNWADGAYFEGLRVTKGEYFNKTMVFDTSTYNGITATIAHPHVLDSNHNPHDPALTPQQRADIIQQNNEDQGIPLTDYPNIRSPIPVRTGTSMPWNGTPKA